MINWKVRFKNKHFVISFIAANLLLVKQVAALFGYNLDTELFNHNINGIVDTVFLMLSLLGIVNDATTQGLSDSKQALTYDKPKQD
jgi:holin, phage phi LC3 family|nr:MAG TPA: holin [Caudoviricetes sp.]DAS17649.1 MAG TPA: holin [Caudoviricetes sp.]DAS30943.1 MAG TPA: holin [Caudoviricetes sp.]